ncbi:hypothetical protein [Micromonospora aurantiaca (nom. illeg.)]|uniref:hypothetical protein n=1 Tax=Micromonospora aurantiaca (nom. illeg.) TaxID=47850 RepID=UPI0011A901EA|nr:hypothetical protein [Micromonospora aurantiaca]MBC9005163.1 hypothetical protein [Micromonospora aurantiaca]
MKIKVEGNLKRIARFTPSAFAECRATANPDEQVALDLLRANPDMSAGRALAEATRRRNAEANADWQATA